MGHVFLGVTHRGSSKSKACLKPWSPVTWSSSYNTWDLAGAKCPIWAPSETSELQLFTGLLNEPHVSAHQLSALMYRVKGSLLLYHRKLVSNIDNVMHLFVPLNSSLRRMKDDVFCLSYFYKIIAYSYCEITHTNIFKWELYKFHCWYIACFCSVAKC